MLDFIKKTMSVGLGLAFLTKEKIEDLANDFIKEGKLSKKEGKKFMDDLSKRSKDARKKMEDKLEKAVKVTLEKMNLPSRDDFLKLEKQVKQLGKIIKEEKTKK